ncbi:MAG: SRPBCC family protein [Actinomycetota bacterium]
MSLIRESIDVDVPVSTAYNQWTQFEEFPRFMEGVDEVRQLDDTRLHWKAEIAGATREWEAKIVEQEPDRVIAWRSEEGVKLAGRVTFEPIDDGSRSRITLEMEFDPEGFVEAVGDTLGFVRARVGGDLERFKKFIEERGVESGAWRGEIKSGTPR